MASPPLISQTKERIEYVFEPKSYSQAKALISDVRFLLHGGAAGSLKTMTMVVNAAKYRHYKRASSIIFRRTNKQLGKIIKMQRELYAPLGAVFNEQKTTWTWPSGATCRLGHLQYEKNINDYYGDEYDYLGFDEATHFTESMVREMTARNRTSDPFLQEHRRIHLATNPGNVGHRWIHHIFLNKGCHHCKHTDETLKPWQIYDDRKWLSDGGSVKFKTQFIPGLINEHDLLGEEYEKETLGTLKADKAKALKEGCWLLWEGIFFDCFDESMVEKWREVAGEIKYAWWWPHWIGVDYGYKGSAAAAYLLTKSPPQPGFPNGRTYIISEMVEHTMLAKDFARKIKTDWMSGDKRFHAYYLSPDSWNSRGDGHTLADQMIQETSINFEKASNDRAGGWHMMYNMLKTGELVVTDNCPKLIEGLQTRVHDREKGGEDIVKIIGDELDDACDAARYAIYSYISEARKPASVRIAEAVTSNDPTTAALQAQAAEAKIAREDEPIFFGGFRRSRG